MRRRASLLIALLVLIAAAPTHAAGKKKPKARTPPPPPCADTTACLAACDQKTAPASCTRLGELHAAGIFAAADGPAALAAWEQGCAGGHARACVLLATELYQGSDDDVTRARAVLTTACDGPAADGRACFNLAEVLADADEPRATVAAREKRAVKRLTAQCKQQQQPVDAMYACATLGRLYAKGYLVKADKARAAALAKRATTLMTTACDAGDVLACLELADDDPARAAAALQKICDAGGTAACDRLKQ